MIAIIAIAVAAGAASALMFASIISGAVISIALFYLAPLPLMVATIGWGPLCAAIGGLGAATGLGLFISFPLGLAFAVAVALPAWWLGHIALLGRPAVVTAAGVTAAAITSEPAAAGTPPALEWYPSGRILLWVASFAAVITSAALLTLGTDDATITSTLRSGLARILSGPDGTLSADSDKLIDAMIRIAPAGAATFATLTLALNLWLAGKITAMSGLLRRPWPDLKSTALPPMTLAALFATIGLCFIGGLIGILALVVTSTLLSAYALTGFAVLHTLTLTVRSRAFWLGSTYALVFMFVWPMLAIVALGLADAAFGLRQRFWQRRRPPLPVP